MESRFGPHFPAVEGREVDKVIAAFALDALRAVPPFCSCASGEICTRVYCGPDRLFRSVVRKEHTICYLE